MTIYWKRNKNHNDTNHKTPEADYKRNHIDKNTAIRGSKPAEIHKTIICIRGSNPSACESAAYALYCSHRRVQVGFMLLHKHKTCTGVFGL